MNDPALWRAKQRLTRLLFVARGVLLLVCAMLVQKPIWLFIALLGAVLVPLVAGSLYSYRLAHRS